MSRVSVAGGQPVVSVGVPAPPAVLIAEHIGPSWSDTDCPRDLLFPDVGTLGRNTAPLPTKKAARLDCLTALVVEGRRAEE